MPMRPTPRRRRVPSALWVALSLSLLPACNRASDSAPREAAERAFSSVCARCHGSDGNGGVAAEGSNPPRKFRDHAFQASRTDEQLKQAIQHGKGAMPAFGNLFSDAELAALVQRVRSFDPTIKP